MFRRALCAFLFTASAIAQSGQPAYLDPKLPAQQRAHDLVSRMTLDEKVTQLEDWAVAIPRLGVPDYQTWNEALHGVARAGYATVFPQAIGMAATWDPAMIRQMGTVISTEGRAKYNQAQRQGNHRIYYGLTFWSPNINIFRDPRWGRGQETYGEDPYLTGQLGVALITGVQGTDPDHPRAVATSKHFAVHSGPEPLRHGFNVNVSPRDLEETYLPAFRATVVDGHVKSVMCAYNAVDDMAACANRMLLREHLRDAWKFAGFVVSDCAAIADVAEGHHNAPDIMHASAISLAAGTDLSCSTGTAGFNTLADAVRQGVISEDLVTKAVERLYTARFELGMFDPPDSNPLDKIPPSEIASTTNRAVSLKAAEESIVLLKNNGVLPFARTPAKIAVVGPGADLLRALEGNYNGAPFHPVTPLDGVVAQFSQTKVLYAQGSTLADGATVPVPRPAFGNGLKTEFFATPDFTGRPVATSTQPFIQFDWRDAAPVPEIETHDYSVRFRGTLAVPGPGKYTFFVEHPSSSPYWPKETYRFLLDGKVISEGPLTPATNELKRPAGMSPSSPLRAASPKPPQFSMDFADTNSHDFQFEYSHSDSPTGGGVTLAWEAPAQPQLDEAIAAAKDADVVLAFVGLSPQLEGEEMRIKIPGFDGGDRTSLDLPKAQEDLLRAVAATGKPLVVVSLSGSALALNWANEHAAAILQAWYPGVEGGTAIARTLAGLNNPAGRLPITFYRGVDDLPPFIDYNMKDRTYRYYTGKPLWGFGYGLSYSSFRYGPVRLSATNLNAGQPLDATVIVINTSKRDGDEVVEAYLTSPQANGPSHALAAFERIHLKAGESRHVMLHFDARSLSSVDDKGDRAVLPGTYHLAIAGAQPNEAVGKAEASFNIAGTISLPK
ncbi:MAG TPA: glycoside hydrolase family 3 C-terminal domain-containing protein [Terriglobales bacterium]|nr:glycoside hydrolase family 3 C-terminal domain-containing protein [Terriglobales bacterium]